MAANFWESSQSASLVSLQRLQESQVDDKLRGLTDEHISLIKVHFTHCIFELARACKLRQRVAGSAVIFFRRFYLRNNFTSQDPRLIAPGCLYLASKSEESLVAAKVLVASLKKLRPSWSYDVKHLLDAEMIIIEDLDFNLVVFNPYRPLKHMIQSSGLTSAAMQAWALLNDSYRSDLLLRWPPFLVALGSLLVAAQLGGLDPSNWVTTLNVDMEQVFDIVLELTTMYERNKAVLSLEECNRLLDTAASATPAVR